MRLDATGCATGEAGFFWALSGELPSSGCCVVQVRLGRDGGWPGSFAVLTQVMARGDVGTAEWTGVFRRLL